MVSMARENRVVTGNVSCYLPIINDELLPLRHVAQLLHSLLMLSFKPLAAPARVNRRYIWLRTRPFRPGGQPALRHFSPERARYIGPLFLR